MVLGAHFLSEPVPVSTSLWPRSPPASLLNYVFPVSLFRSSSFCPNCRSFSQPPNQCVSQFHPPISVPVSSPGSQSKPLTSESKSPTAPRCAPSFLLFFSLILKPRLFQSLSVQVFKVKSKKTLQGLIKEVRDKYLAALTVLLVAETDLLTQMSKVTLPLNFRGIGLQLCGRQMCTLICNNHVSNKKCYI